MFHATEIMMYDLQADAVELTIEIGQSGQMSLLEIPEFSRLECGLKSPLPSTSWLFGAPSMAPQKPRCA